MPPDETNSKAAWPSQVIWISFFGAGARVCPSAIQTAVTRSTLSHNIFHRIKDFFVAICKGGCLFPAIRQHAKHANRHRLAVTLNASFFNLTLDDGSCRKRATAVFLELDLVMTAF